MPMIYQACLLTIGQSLQFSDWKTILDEFNKQTGYPGCVIRALSQAERVLLYDQEVNPRTDLFTLEIKAGRGVLGFKGKTYGRTAVTAWFRCRNVGCKCLFKVEYNPARNHLNSFLCKRCKKSVHHKCLDYRKHYETSMMMLYGVKRPLQNKVSKQKFERTMLARHGVRYTGESSELRAKTICQFGQSKGELELGRELLGEYGPETIRCEPNQKILVEPHRWIYPDILVGQSQIIEYFGDYWHGNPQYYGPGDLVSNAYTAQEVWNMDQERATLIRRAGYEIMVVWEHDWKTNRHGVLEKIRKWINL